MTRHFVRGACPALTAPMATGDGLLARLRPAGPIPLDAFATLCAAAHAHGNGIVEISARGSLQVRGLTPASAPLFAEAVEALGIDLCDGVPVIASPLSGDPSALIDARALAADIRHSIADGNLSLAPKVSVAVDGGGHLHLDALTADLRLRAVPGDGEAKLHVSLAGDAKTAVPLGTVAPEDTARLITRLLGVIAANGPDARAAGVLRRDGIAAFRAVAGTLDPAAPLAARPPAEPIGLHRLKGSACAIGVALPFGHAQAEDLIVLARIAKANGAAWATCAPGRTLLMGPIGEMTGFVLATAADSLGFVVDARDGRRRVVACAGAPRCASGLIAARALAAEIAAHVPLAGEGLAVHVSGCAKGCAHSRVAPLTIVGTAEGCGIVRGGTARARPARHVEARDLLTEIAMPKPAKEAVDA